MDSNLAYQEERLEELIGGSAVLMAPASTNHTFIAGNIYHVFASYLHRKLCTPISDGVTVHLTDRDRFVPDMMVVCDPDKIRPDGVYGAPDLVVEVLSPGTAKRDKTYKKDIYARCGVREYWLVYPEDKAVEVYRSDGTDLLLHDIHTLYPAWMLEQMSEEKRAAVETHFQCGLFDDLDISLEDVFYRTF